MRNDAKEPTAAVAFLKEDGFTKGRRICLSSQVCCKLEKGKASERKYMNSSYFRIKMDKDKAIQKFLDWMDEPVKEKYNKRQENNRGK